MEKSKGVPNIIWIAIVIFIGYFIISDIQKNIEEKRQIMIIENEIKHFNKQINKTFEQNDKIMNEALNYNNNMLGNMNHLRTIFDNAKKQIEIKPVIKHSQIRQTNTIIQTTKKETNKKAKINITWKETKEKQF